MAVHLPLSAEAQAEARSLMLASDNILKPADGHVVSMPSQDMILGLYYLTTVMDGAKGQGRVFSSYAEAQMALDLHEIDMQAEVLIRLPKDFVLPTGWEPREITVVDPEPGSPDVVKEERFHDGSVLFATSMGRILFNETLPVDYPFVNEQAKKKKLAKIVDDISTRYSTAQVAASLDALKDLGFTRAPWSGVTFAFSDVVEPPERNELVAQSEEEVAKINEQYDLGFYTEEDRRQAIIDVWTKCGEEVSKAIEKNFDPKNNLSIIVESGARGNMTQINQISGVRGLVNNPKGEIIPRPVESNYRRGLSVLEYFISEHGARKGLADTALRTAESGYLTRRLVDVSQDVIVREEDCGTKRGLTMRVADRDENGNLTLVKAADGGPYSRLLAADVIDRPTARPCCTSATTPVDGRAQRPGRARRRRGAGAFRPDLRVQARRVRQVLRLVAGHQHAGGRRRGRRHRRCPVHRRAWYSADAAFLPLRWCGRRVRYHPGSSPCHRAFRSPYPEG